MKQAIINIVAFFLCCLTTTANQSILSEKTDRFTISVIGTGYVGLVLGAGLAELGHQVTCIDIDESKIAQLEEGNIPFFEPGLSQLVTKNVSERTLFFTTKYDSIATSDLVFIAVGTPSNSDGSCDTSAVFSAVETILSISQTTKIICIKSTVPIGTCCKIEQLIKEKQLNNALEVVSNPEFLREGSAVQDFFNPDRIVIGAHSQKASDSIKKLFSSFISKNIPVLETDLASAETIKYASNAFLAIKISYINEIAHLCEKVNANCADVAFGMGLDKRIGHKFLKPGPGFGGSCLPKDTRALLHSAREVGVNFNLVKAALETNQHQKELILAKVCGLLDDDLGGKTIGIWGLAFKAGTDDIRESSALYIIEQLLKKGALIKAYDPIAMNNCKKIFPEIEYCNSKEDALADADLLLILTEWDEFKTIESSNLRSGSRLPKIFDTRNILSIVKLENELIHH